jgi:hypothetical protein
LGIPVSSIIQARIASRACMTGKTTPLTREITASSFHADVETR